MDSQSNNMIPMIYGLKLMKLGSVFVAVNIAANYMSQIYMEKVLANQENPQPLINFIWMYSLVDVLFTVLILAITYSVSTFIGSNMNQVMSALVLDNAISLISVSLLGGIVAHTMYSKKFFMYKDDGLRAIRGLKEIVLHFGLLATLAPFFMIKQT